MKRFNKGLNRRDFVKNSAGSVAAASMVNAFSQRALAAETPFKRCIFWYVPEGAAQQAFWPAQEGRIVIDPNASVDGKNPKSNLGSIRNYINKQNVGGVENRMASYCLQPLAEHIDDFSLYSGFENPRGPGANHAGAVNGALTGGTVNDGSLDQILAGKIQGDAAIPYIYSSVYGHHVHDRGSADSFMSPVRAVGGGLLGSANWNPIDVYKDLFPEGIPAPNSGGADAGFADSKAGRIAILSSAEKQLEKLKCEGGDAARLKLESLLESYQKLEKTTQAIIDADNGLTGGADARFDFDQAWLKTAGNRRDNTKYWNQSTNFGKLVDIAIDTTVAALALDRTRVATIQYSASGDNKGAIPQDHYKKVGIAGLENTNTQDHHFGHDPAPDRRRDQARVFRWYYKKLAELIRKLKEFPDGEGSLFDSTLIVCCSEFGMYNHRYHDVPYLCASGLGNIRKGQYQNVSTGSGGNTMRSSSDFLFGVSKALDVNLPSFGNSTTPFTI